MIKARIYSVVCLLLLATSVIAIVQPLAVDERVKLEDVVLNRTVTYLEPVVTYYDNSSCGVSPTNGSTLVCQYNTTVYVTSRIVTKEYAGQVLTIKGKVYNTVDINAWCYEEFGEIICKSTSDGDGWLRKKGLKPGASYFVIENTGNVKEPVKNHRKSFEVSR